MDSHTTRRKDRLGRRSEPPAHADRVGDTGKAAERIPERRSEDVGVVRLIDRC